MNRLFQFICIFIALLYSMSNFAASLQVAPISLSFTAQEKAKEIWLINTSDQPIRAQTRIFSWSQVDGKDELNASRDLAASPSITEIKAGDRQLIRIIRIAPLNSEKEQSYRLLIDELPSSSQTNVQTGLQLLLQYSVPVFFPTTENATTREGLAALNQLSFKYQQQQLIAQNNGKRHIRISELAYINPNGEKIVLISGLVGYVLAGERMQWDIVPPANMLPNGRFEARINNDGLAQILAIQ